MLSCQRAAAMNLPLLFFGCLNGWCLHLQISPPSKCASKKQFFPHTHTQKHKTPQHTHAKFTFSRHTANMSKQPPTLRLEAWTEAESKPQRSCRPAYPCQNIRNQGMPLAMPGDFVSTLWLCELIFVTCSQSWILLRRISTSHGQVAFLVSYCWIKSLLRGHFWKLGGTERFWCSQTFWDAFQRIRV